MTTIAVAMVRNEEDIIASTVGWMLTQVDHVIVADNGSTDSTRSILEGLGVEVVDDPEVAFYQAVKTTELAGLAIEQGADWVVAFDADEIWTSPHGRLGDILEAHTPDYGLVTAELYDYVATDLDGYDPDPVKRLQWRRVAPLPLLKVAARAEPGVAFEQGNHWAHHRIPARFTESPALVVRHLPYRSVGQFIAKARQGSAAYAAATNLHSSVGAHWRQWGHFTDEQLTEVFSKYYYRKDPRLPLMLDGEEQPPLIRDPIHQVE